MIEFNLEGKEYIELNKLLKILKLVGTGGEANMLIESGEIIVNDVVETRKRNKIRTGFVVSFQEISIFVK